MTASEVLPVILYILGAILLVALIVLTIKLTITIHKIDKVVDNITEKVTALDGVFSVVNAVSNKFTFITDKVVNIIYSLIEKITKRKEDWKMSKKGLGKFVIGAGLALLFAPKKGSDLRRDIKRKFDEFMKDVDKIEIEDIKESFTKKVDEIKKELEDLDKEKVEKIAKKKAKELQRKAEDLVDLAKEKGTPVLEGIADDLKHKVICVCTEVINKLEKGE